MDSTLSALTGTKLRSHIEKKPYTQRMNDIDYTYSIIPKKQKNFVLTNNRFLVLKGIETISYARAFPDNVPLPFRSPAELPKPKVSYPVAAIQYCNSEQEKLIIEFSVQDKPRWQFICPSKGCAHEWRKRIEMATNQLVRFNLSKMERYEDYLAKKRQDEEADRLRKQQEINKLNNPQTPVKNSNLSANGVIANTVDILIKPQEKQQNMFNTFNMKHVESTDYQPVTQQKQTNQVPVANKEDISAMEKLLTNGPPSSVPLMKKSVSTISVSGKQNIRSEIASYRRNWLDQFISHKQQSELIIDFKGYVQKIAEVIISQLYIPQETKIFPYRQWNKDFASFNVDDIYVQIFFYNEDQLEKKHKRERYFAKEFKNYDYLLESTKNQGRLLVPLMATFEYKGFTGMAKTIVGSQNAPAVNKQCLGELNLDQLRYNARVEPRILLEQSKCRIVAYEPQRLTLNQSQIGRVYFLDGFSQFLPSEISESLQEKKLLRPELVQDPSLSEYVFGDRERQAGPFELQTLIDKNVNSFIMACQTQSDYFTNSSELTQLMHSFGLNMRHLGLVMGRTHQQWLKKIIQAEVAARSLKNFFRFDMQNCILNQTERSDHKQRQSQRQRKRAISFLNVVLGNTEPTFHLWRSLNHYCRQQFKCPLWEQNYSDINICYFLQALQSHLKITLSEQIHNRSFFKSSHSLADSDFIKFNVDVTIYNLDFTEAFQKIYDCLQEKDGASFAELSRLMTRQSSRGRPYLFLLKGHPIHQKISEYFLYFITPDQYNQFYTSLDQISLPSRFAYECHLTQIKWFIKNNPDFVIKPIKFILNSGRRWLGQPHPLFVKMNHTLAEYYMDNPYFYSKAISHATQSLEIQQALSQGESEWMWKDYYLIGKIHFVNNNFQNALPSLLKAKQMVVLEHLNEFESYGEMILALCKTYFAMNNYREAYSLVRQLYNDLREKADEESQQIVIECVEIIRSLLEKSQEYDTFYKFIETDFSLTLINAVGNSSLLARSVKLIVIPYIKFVINQKSAIRGQMYNLIGQLLKIPITNASCEGFLEISIRKGRFPQQFFGVLKNIEKVLNQIYANNMIERWTTFNRMSNQTLLQRIGGTELSREFYFLAELTSVLGLLGESSRREFVFMQN